SPQKISTAVKPTPLGFFETLSPLYWAQFQESGWEYYEKDPSPRSALTLFLGGYAFERRGRAENYPHAALAAVQEADSLDPQGLWESFEELLAGQPLNRNLNPLRHIGSANCDCVGCVLASEPEQDIVVLIHQLLSSGNTRKAFATLNRIRGVGAKIASFFLRDVADRHSF